VARRGAELCTRAQGLVYMEFLVVGFSSQERTINRSFVFEILTVAKFCAFLPGVMPRSCPCAHDTGKIGDSSIIALHSRRSKFSIDVWWGNAS